MPAQTLYLFMGYPGAGKTTVARTIADLTGAVHLWADQERHARFGHATHTPEESAELYAYLNGLTDQLLGEGKSVIFDTNFNFRADRAALAAIATRHGAATVVIRLTTPKDVARLRALDTAHHTQNGYDEVMSPEQFERLSDHLEEPGPDERVIELDGSNLSEEAVGQALANLA